MDIVDRLGSELVCVVATASADRCLQYDMDAVVDEI